MTLTEFLLARIAEDETVARAGKGDTAWSCDPSRANPIFAQVVSGDGAVASAMLTTDGEHIARHDPARVLAECEAKRRIVSVRAAIGMRHGGTMDEVDAAHAAVQKQREWTWRLLALPYAGHPDYLAEWATS